MQPTIPALVERSGSQGGAKHGLMEFGKVAFRGLWVANVGEKDVGRLQPLFYWILWSLVPCKSGISSGFWFNFLFIGHSMACPCRRIVKKDTERLVEHRKRAF